MQNSKEFILVNTAFPRIGTRLKLFWGEPEFKPYMDGLVMSGRTGKRQGFPKDIAEALLRLASLHERRFPTKAKETEKVDIWDPWS